MSSLGKVFFLVVLFISSVSVQNDKTTASFTAASVDAINSKNVTLYFGQLPQVTLGFIGKEVQQFLTSFNYSGAII